MESDSFLLAGFGVACRRIWYCCPAACLVRFLTLVGVGYANPALLLSARLCSLFFLFRLYTFIRAVLGNHKGCIVNKLCRSRKHCNTRAKKNHQYSCCCNRECFQLPIRNLYLLGLPSAKAAFLAVFKASGSFGKVTV